MVKDIYCKGVNMKQLNPINQLMTVVPLRKSQFYHT